VVYGLLLVVAGVLLSDGVTAYLVSKSFGGDAAGKTTTMHEPGFRDRIAGVFLGGSRVG
jgi:hypothetical protein